MALGVQEGDAGCVPQRAERHQRIALGSSRFPFVLPSEAIMPLRGAIRHEKAPLLRTGSWADRFPGAFRTALTCCEVAPLVILSLRRISQLMPSAGETLRLLSHLVTLRMTIEPSCLSRSERHAAESNCRRPSMNAHGEGLGTGIFRTGNLRPQPRDLTVRSRARQRAPESIMVSPYVGLKGIPTRGGHPCHDQPAPPQGPSQRPPTAFLPRGIARIPVFGDSNPIKFAAPSWSAARPASRSTSQHRY